MKTYVLFINEDSENPRLFTGDIANLNSNYNWVIFEYLLSSTPILVPLSVSEAERNRYLKRIK